MKLLKEERSVLFFPHINKPCLTIWLLLTCLKGKKECLDRIYVCEANESIYCGELLTLT